MRARCNICPRRCNAERRVDTGDGYCAMGSTIRIARIAPHMWEEPCISGEKGSGTVFFSGCSLRCAYCQNGEISHHPKGKPYSPETLAPALAELEETGVHNINFVTPTHYTAQILDTLALRKPTVPVVWNTSGYELPETIAMLAGHVDIYLTDLKHKSEKMSALCANAPDYFYHAEKAITEMCRQRGPAVYDSQGIMKSGVILRHLILPGLTKESISLLNWVAETLPEGTPVSLMRQYVPLNNVKIPGLTRPITDREYDRVANHMQILGLRGFYQEKGAADAAYVPHFEE